MIDESPIVRFRATARIVRPLVLAVIVSLLMWTPSAESADHEPDQNPPQGLNPSMRDRGLSCKQFARMIREPDQEILGLLEVDSKLPENSSVYEFVDIDGDRRADHATLSCSASSDPSDPCLLGVHQSRGPDYAVEGFGLTVIRYGHRLYAVSREEYLPARGIHHWNLVWLTAEGGRRTCSVISRE